MVGIPTAEAMVSRVTKGDMSVATLSTLIEGCVQSGEFSLMRQGNLTGKHVGENYKSAEAACGEVTKAVRKRVERGHTKGPYRMQAADLPFDDYAINSIGAVAKRGSTDMRPVDDTLANDDIGPPTLPTFAMPAIAIMRELATQGCWWWTVDIEDAFSNLPIAPEDRPWMLFRWFDLEDKDHEGTSHDAVYMHVKGNFGPRPLPYWYTMFQLYLNICFMATYDVTHPPVGFIDDNTHKSNHQDECLEVMQAYKLHVRRAGVHDKESKEVLPFQKGIVLGRYFDSIKMTISITVDKLLDLMWMMQSCACKEARQSLQHMECMLGLWEFCLECLPDVLRSYAHNTHSWIAKLRKLGSHKLAKHRVPAQCKDDINLMIEVIPLCNGTQPLQPWRAKPWARPVFTDASRKAGGYVTPTRCYAREFTCRERKLTIAVLEAKMVEDAIEHNCHEWQGCVLPIYIDNTTAKSCFQRGRSRERKLNSVVRAVAVLCATYDILPVYFYVRSEENILADALSRGWYDDFTLALKYFVWPDTERTMPLGDAEAMKKHLPTHLNKTREKLQSKAYAKGSETTWTSGWRAWCEFCAESRVLPMGVYSDGEMDVLMATFRAALANGSYGMGKVKRTATVDNYASAVTNYRGRHFGDKEEAMVVRGLTRERGKDQKPKVAVTLDVACDLAMLANANNLEHLRNQVAYVALGQGTSRAQAVSISAAAKLEQDWATNKVVMADAVVIDYVNYGVRFGLKKQEKQDYGGQLIGPDGYEWVYVKGIKGCVLDAVFITQLYVNAMGFENMTCANKAKTPFWQTVELGRPTGRPMSYDSFLRSFRRDLNRLPRDKYPFHDWTKYGLHAWRRFGATVAHFNGVPNDVIQELGRWRSDAFLAYFALTHEEGFARQSLMLKDGAVVHGADGKLSYGSTSGVHPPTSQALVGYDGKTAKAVDPHTGIGGGLGALRSGPVDHPRGSLLPCLGQTGYAPELVPGRLDHPERSLEGDGGQGGASGDTGNVGVAPHPHERGLAGKRRLAAGSGRRGGVRGSRGRAGAAGDGGGRVRGRPQGVSGGVIPRKRGRPRGSGVGASGASTGRSRPPPAGGRGGSGHGGTKRPRGRPPKCQ